MRVSKAGLSHVSDVPNVLIFLGHVERVAVWRAERPNLRLVRHVLQHVLGVREHRVVFDGLVPVS